MLCSSFTVLIQPEYSRRINACRRVAGTLSTSMLIPRRLALSRSTLTYALAAQSLADNGHREAGNVAGVFHRS